MDSESTPDEVNDQAYQALYATVPTFKTEEQRSQAIRDFDEDQILAFKVCFSKFEKSEKVAVTQIGPLLRATGLNPTEKYLKELTEWFSTNAIESLGFEDFRTIMKYIWIELDQSAQVNQLKTAFEMLDPRNNGFFPVQELKKILSTFGEVLDENDWKEITKSVVIQPDDTINNEDFIKILATTFKP